MFVRDDNEFDSRAVPDAPAGRFLRRNGLAAAQLAAADGTRAEKDHYVHCQNRGLFHAPCTRLGLLTRDCTIAVPILHTARRRGLLDTGRSVHVGRGIVPSLSRRVLTDLPRPFRKRHATNHHSAF
jgi:hypothetical protein